MTRAATADEGTPLDLHLVTWDVDGTILRATGDVANKLHHRAFSHSWRTVYGIDFHVRDIPHQGSTDPLILLAGVRASPDTDRSHEEAFSLLKEAQDAMTSFYQQAATDAAVAAEGLALLPGVEGVLEALSAREEVVQGLVTGNLEPIAWKKVETLGVARHFDEIRGDEKRVGGFGSDVCSPDASAIDEPWQDRAKMLEVAAERALRAAASDKNGEKRPVRIARRVHLGDTVFDMKAAAAVGALPVGVATGIFSKEELLAAEVPGAVVLDDLSDLEASLKAMGF